MLISCSRMTTTSTLVRLSTGLVSTPPTGTTKMRIEATLLGIGRAGMHTHEIPPSPSSPRKGGQCRRRRRRRRTGRGGGVKEDQNRRFQKLIGSVDKASDAAAPKPKWGKCRGLVFQALVVDKGGRGFGTIHVSEDRAVEAVAAALMYRDEQLKSLGLDSRSFLPKEGQVTAMKQLRALWLETEDGKSSKKEALNPRTLESMWKVGSRAHKSERR